MALTKVSVVKCDEYILKDVKKAIQDSFGMLGGIEKYIDKGDRVLLKLNLLMRKRPEEAATTHAVFIQALSEILVEYGAAVVLGDSPGGPFNDIMLRGIYRTTGTEEAAKQSGASLNRNYGQYTIENQNGAVLKSITLASMLKDVDKVIDVCKLKTHSFATFSGAVKNMFGAVPGLIKAEMHFNMPEITVFSNAIVDVCMACKPVLSFMDAIVGMEGAGPSGGNPRKIGAVIASPSPYHLDKVACELINLNLELVPTIKRCAERGICTIDMTDIDILGDDIDSLRVTDYDIPIIRSLDTFLKIIPKFMRPFIGKHVQPRPVIKTNNCVSCGICMQSCPAKAIHMFDHELKPGKNNNKQYPVVKLENCIRCFCCQELCPKKAIVVYRPKLLRLIYKKNK